MYNLINGYLSAELVQHINILKTRYPHRDTLLPVTDEKPLFVMEHQPDPVLQTIRPLLLTPLARDLGIPFERHTLVDIEPEHIPATTRIRLRNIKIKSCIDPCSEPLARPRN